MNNANEYLSNVPDVLKEYYPSIVYKLRLRGETLQKLPQCLYDLTLGEVNAFRSRNQGIFAQCAEVAIAAGAEFGAGIVLRAGGPWVVDIDFREAENATRAS